MNRRVPQLRANPFTSVDELLDFAIAKEAESAVFYEALALRATNPVMRMYLLDFAGEERSHREKLLGFQRSGAPLLPSGRNLETMGFSRHIEPIIVTEHLTMAQALQLAMREEKAAFALYYRMAEATDDRKLRGALMTMAEEEAKHKLRFELEYEALLFAAAPGG